jgi:Ca2+-binding RTX toxin-like protein
MYGRIKRVGPALLITLGVAAFPGSALAGTAYVDGDTVVYHGYAGENNHVEVGQREGDLKVDVEIFDSAKITPGAGCSRVNDFAVECGVSRLTGHHPAIAVDLGNLNDRLEPAFIRPVHDIPLEAQGGPGNDTLLGGDESDDFDGGDGEDTISGGVGPDVLSGYYGVDIIHGNENADTIDGGPGDDDLNGDAGNDTISGNAGGDTLRGGSEDDTLYGNAGQDSLLGNLGKDKYFGGTEADSINSDDDQNETVDCGSGWFANDKADINDGDTAIDCEITS